MKLEVNEQTVTENCTTDDLKQLSFDETVCIQEGEGHYLQLWVDEEEDGNELYYRVPDGPALTCAAPSSLDAVKLNEIFCQFLNGDQSWAEKFEWADAPAPGDDGVLIDPELTLGAERWEVYP